MYTPEHFQETSIKRLHDFIEANAFGAIVSTTENGSTASHLPFLINRSFGSNGRLIAHLSKTNPHWKQFDGTTEALVIFQGAHCYISPTWYAGGRGVPTWNYEAVHATGRPQLIDETDELRSLVMELSDKYERSRSEPWVQAKSENIIDKQLAGIIGLTMTIDVIEGQFKFNQNHSVENQRGVIDGLRVEGDPDQIRVAEIMEGNL